MKSAYELAMERLNREAPSKPLSDGQKAALAEIDNRYEAKEAERKIAMGAAITEARAAGKQAEALDLEEKLRIDLGRIERERDAEKAKVRGA